MRDWDPAPRRDKVWVPPKRRAREPVAPPPRPPRRFKVVDVVTRRVLAEDAGAAETLGVLAEVPRMLDVTVSVWEPDGERWRVLSLAEQETLWARRRPRADG